MTTKTRRALETDACQYLNRAGYFQGELSSQVYTFGPRCRHRLDATLPYGAKGWPATRKALTTELVNHWEDHPECAP